LVGALKARSQAEARGSPGKPVNATVRAPIFFASLIASKTFTDLPLVLMPTKASFAVTMAFTCRENIWEKS
jgi:hypothetical protein